MTDERARLPKRGIPQDELLATMAERKRLDANWREGRLFSLLYPVSDEVDELLREANLLYLYENALNPFRFPSLRTMEQEVVEIAAGLLHAPPEAGGCMTSGGTESILMAVKSARDWARAERGITEPEMLVPYSAHPAFAKAASYLGLELKTIPLGDDLRADVAAAAERISERTALVVGSAPCYPFGVIDPIPELAALAAEHGAWFHTDACVGGFFLPFQEKLGEEVPPFDFRVPGVRSISADVHKYGYATKGASVILHRDAETLRRHQLFIWTNWPGGLYGSFAMAGARPAAPIAAAWAILHFLGEEGYLRLTRQVLDTVDRIRGGIEEIAELELVGEPAMSVLAFTAPKADIMGIGDAMDERGWNLDRQTGPDALHMMVSPIHARVVDRFLADLRDAVKHHRPSEGKEARYS